VRWHCESELWAKLSTLCHYLTGRRPRHLAWSGSSSPKVEPCCWTAPPPGTEDGRGRLSPTACPGPEEFWLATFEDADGNYLPARVAESHAVAASCRRSSGPGGCAAAGQISPRRLTQTGAGGSRRIRRQALPRGVFELKCNEADVSRRSVERRHLALLTDRHTQVPTYPLG
jgi:hypothetical protein